MAVMMILMVVWMVAMGPHDGHAERERPPAAQHEEADGPPRSHMGAERPQ